MLEAALACLAFGCIGWLGGYCWGRVKSTEAADARE